MPSSGFTPIPGVWYETLDESHPSRLGNGFTGPKTLLYAPSQPTEPGTFHLWYDSTSDAWLQHEQVLELGELRVAYNPHPPTRTEWGVWKRSGGWQKVNDEAHAHAVVNKQRTLFAAVGKRQVSEAEWVEVDEKETGNE